MILTGEATFTPSGPQTISAMLPIAGTTGGTNRLVVTATVTAAPAVSVIIREWNGAVMIGGAAGGPTSPCATVAVRMLGDGISGPPVCEVTADGVVVATYTATTGTPWPPPYAAVIGGWQGAWMVYSDVGDPPTARGFLTRWDGTPLPGYYYTSRCITGGGISRDNSDREVTVNYPYGLLPHAYHRPAAGEAWAEASNVFAYAAGLYPLHTTFNGRTVLWGRPENWISRDGGASYEDGTGVAVTNDAVTAALRNVRLIGAARAGERCLGLVCRDASLYAVTDAVGGGFDVDEIAAVGEAAEAVAWPDGNGRWQVRAWDDGVVSAYSASVGDEGNWAAGDTEDLGDDGNLRHVALAVSRAGEPVFLGHHTASGEFRCVTGDAGSFGAPVTVAASQCERAYIAQLPTGKWEVAWPEYDWSDLTGNTVVWHKWQADHPEAAWSEV